MDRLIYTSMTGANHTLNQQATVAHNLANVSTTGFRAENNAFRAVPIYGDGAPTRAFVVDTTVGADFTPGPLQGPGWIAVQLDNGEEAYTRNGSLQVSPNGILLTQNGLKVKGENGIIALPPDTRITVGVDGTVSAVPISPQPNTVAQVGRIKLVNPPEENLEKGVDGLFRQKDGKPAPLDARVRLIDGTLEGSNVNVVHEMVSMIALARQFDMQMKMMENAEKNAQQASQIMVLRV